MQSDYLAYLVEAFLLELPGVTIQFHNDKRKHFQPTAKGQALIQVSQISIGDITWFTQRPIIQVG
jgi:hypothetical protein